MSSRQNSTKNNTLKTPSCSNLGIPPLSSVISKGPVILKSTSNNLADWDLRKPQSSNIPSSVQQPDLNCPFCTKTFAQLSAFHRHVDSHRRVPQCFPCWHCQKGFSRKGVLMRHVKQVHEFDDSQRVSCEHCGKTFKFKSSLENHIKIHSPATFECAVCKKSFKCERYLKTHMQRHSPSMHACRMCGKLFAAHVDVLKHYKVHKDLFRCEECATVFPNIASKIIHCCSKVGRKFRVSDEMAQNFVARIRDELKRGNKPDSEAAFRLMRESIPASLCTEHTLFSLDTRFNLKIKNLGRGYMTLPPPPPPSSPPMSEFDFFKSFETVDGQSNTPGSVFSNSLSSYPVSKSLLPSDKKIHWHIGSQDLVHKSQRAEEKEEEIIEQIKAAVERGKDHIELEFSASKEASLIIAMTKSLVEKGFKCWNFQRAESKEERTKRFLLHIEWGHLAASH